MSAAGGGIADGIGGDDAGVGGVGVCVVDGITGGGSVGFSGVAVIRCSQGAAGPPADAGAGGSAAGGAEGDVGDVDAASDGATSGTRSGDVAGCDIAPPGSRGGGCCGAGGGGRFVAQHRDSDRIVMAARTVDIH